MDSVKIDRQRTPSSYYLSMVRKRSFQKNRATPKARRAALLALALLSPQVIATEISSATDGSIPPIDEAVDLKTLESEHEALVAATGDETLDAARSLIRLGAKQYHEGLHFYARDNLRRAVRIYEELVGPFDTDLVEPLTYLGLNLQAMGHHEAAADTFTRAQHITHRSAGMLNPDQVPMIYSRIDSLRVLGEFWEVGQLLTSAVKLQKHNYGADDDETVASVNQLGLWLAQRGRYHPALSLYDSTRRQMEAEGKEFSGALLELLKGKAFALLFVPQLERHSLDQLAEAKHLADQHAEKIDPARRLTAALNYADMLMVFEREQEAVKIFRDAWELTQTEPELAGEEAKQFGPLKLVRSPLEIIDPAKPPVDRWVRMQFDLSADGRPRNPRVIESNGSIKFRQGAVAFFRISRFRPTFVDGVAQKRKDQELHLQFREAFLQQER